MAKPKLEPTVTIGGAQAGYKPVTSLQSTATFGGAEAAYKQVATPNYITGAGVPGVQTTGTSSYRGFRAAEEASKLTGPEKVTDVLPPPEKPITNGKFPPRGTLLRYIPGKTPDTHIPVYADGNGGEYLGPEELITVIPGSTGLNKQSERTLALDTFKNTLALFFGIQEMSQPWVNALYSSVSGFYNTGSTIDESLNLSLQEVRNNPALKPFTDRFKGLYALQDRLAKGEAIEVPTIAEFFKSESAMGDVLRQAGMGELATQQFLGDVLGMGKSVLEVTNLINDTFYSIDNAPAALKKDLDSIMGLGVSRTDIAKALLTGKEGAAELNKKIKGVSTFSAAKSQGVNIGMETAADIAARGFDYNQSLSGFGTVKRLERGQTLGQISGIDFTQQEAIASTFENSVQAQEKINKISELEAGRFSARPGRLASQSRAQGLI